MYYDISEIRFTKPLEFESTSGLQRCGLVAKWANFLRLGRSRRGTLAHTVQVAASEMMLARYVIYDALCVAVDMIP